MRLIGPVLAIKSRGAEEQKEGHMIPSEWAGGWGREELMVVNSKTGAVLHVGGGVPGQGWSRSWAG